MFPRISMCAWEFDQRAALLMRIKVTKKIKSMWEQVQRIRFYWCSLIQRKVIKSLSTMKCSMQAARPEKSLRRWSSLILVNLSSEVEFCRKNYLNIWDYLWIRIKDNKRWKELELYWFCFGMEWEERLISLERDFVSDFLKRKEK